MNRTWAGLILVLIALGAWGISTAIVYWDAGRRLAPGQRRWWTAAAALIPFAGFFAYWLIRILNAFLDPEEPHPRLRWVTRIQRPRGLPGHGSTIAAANAIEEPRTARQANPPGSPRPPEQPGAPSPWRGGLLWVAALEGPEAGKRFMLKGLPAVIGRGPQIQVALDADIGVSRRHAEIYVGAGLRLRDLGSTHGTFINGARIADEPIHPGDRITVGQTTLQILENRSGG